jgi:hypothetical protein
MRCLAFVLAALSMLTMSHSQAREETTRFFDGVWQSCQTWKGGQACIYYILKQKSDRICGLWHYWASRQNHDGRLIADARRLSARITFICGTPGSETGMDCAGDGVPFTPSQWERTERPLLICDGRLFDVLKGEGNSCADTGKAKGLPRVSQFAQPSVSESDRAWLRACLDDQAYPPPDLKK